jgi:hypothetical protein
MPQDAVPRRHSLVFPILLITLGVLFLYAQWHPDFDPWHLLGTYWPLLLIAIGLGKIWDSTRQRQDPTAARRSSVGSTIFILSIVFVLAMVFWHGHGFARGRRGGFPMQHQSRTLERQGAKAVRASIDMGAGELSVSGGSANLLEANFDYRGSSATPNVDYHVNDGQGELNVSEGDSDSHIHTTSDNTWTLRLANDIPMDLKINMGAGEGRLRLRDLDLTNLEINMGAGSVDVDLTGDRKKDLHADIQGGVGQATIRLPKKVGVIVNASGGIGTVVAHGFQNEGNEYTNEAYGKTPATIHLNVQGGVGVINLVLEP